MTTLHQGRIDLSDTGDNFPGKHAHFQKVAERSRQILKEGSITGLYATDSGGYQNTASNSYSTVGGGQNNIASGYASTIAGGHDDVASGTSSFIAGGAFNVASGVASFALGLNAET